MDVTAAALRYFVTLAEELHYARAAERLHITPPSLSQQISRLERQVGRRLFDRSPRTVALTPAGAELLPLAIAATRAHEAVAAWAGTTPASTPIRIGVVAGAGGSLSEVLATVIERYPETIVQIARLGFFGVEEAVRARRVDVAFGFAPIDPSRDVVVTPLLQEGRVLVVRDDHPLAERETVRIEETNALDFVVPAGADGDARAWWLVDPRPDGSRPRVITVADDVEGLMELCAAGIGVNIATESLSVQTRRPGLAYIPIADIPPADVLICSHPAPGHPATEGVVRIALEVAARSRIPHRRT